VVLVACHDFLEEESRSRKGHDKYGRVIEDTALPPLTGRAPLDMVRGGRRRGGGGAESNKQRRRSCVARATDREAAAKGMYIYIYREDLSKSECGETSDGMAIRVR
jgi:hypothetical protein